MSRCWPEGEWRAYLDCELPPRELAAGEQHLKECRRCAALFQVVEKRAARLSAWMGELEYMPVPAAVPVRRAPVRRWGAAAALAVACAALVLVVLWQRPAVKVSHVGAGAPDRSAARVRESPSLRPAPAVTGPRPRGGAVRAREEKSEVQYYIALDDEPIESGVVARVTLPGSGILADVIYDDEGRPRAVRPLN